MMADLRATTNDFKETWEREVNFEEETKALRFQDIENEAIERKEKPAAELPAPAKPEIREVDAAEISATSANDAAPPPETHVRSIDPNDKRNWL